MLTEFEIHQLLPPSLRHLFRYIRLVMDTVFGESRASGEARLEEKRRAALFLTIVCSECRASDEPAFLAAFIATCKDMSGTPLPAGLVARLQALRWMPMPPLPPLPGQSAPAPLEPTPPPAWGARAPERARIAARRDHAASAAGLRLARMACAMRGCFRWVSSGPGAVRNTDFLRWIRDPRPVALRSDARMNCWEAVMYVAWCANLVDRDLLRRVHDFALIQMQISRRPDAYFHALMMFLGIRHGAVVDLRDGFIPRRGDLLFWENGFGLVEHVAISLGRRWEPTANGGWRSVDRIMSLWHHRGGRLAELDLDDIPEQALDREGLRLVPCPFRL